MSATQLSVDPPARGRLGLGLAIAVVVVALDQATKVYAERVLELGEFVPWLSDSIGWELVHNPGAAFGLPVPAQVFPFVAIAVAVLVVVTLTRTSHALPATGYALLLAGAVGNLLDRVLREGDPGDPSLFHGHVVDFVAWGSFPRFNVADAAINIGVLLLVAEIVRDAAGAGGAPRTDPMLHDLGASGPRASGTVRVLSSPARDDTPAMDDDGVEDVVPDGTREARAADPVDGGTAPDRDEDPATPDEPIRIRTGTGDAGAP